MDVAEAQQKLESIRRRLNAEADLDGNVRSDLQSHLTEVFARIIQYHPFDAYDRFEEISGLVKKTHLEISDPKYDFEINGGSQYSATVTNREAIQLVEKAKLLFKEKHEAGVAAEDKKLIAKGEDYAIPNLVEQMKMLEWAGVNFGEDNVYILQKSLKKLAVLSGASSVMFFGKIFGTEKDYWIAQGTIKGEEEKIRNPHQEKRGAGANTHVFWVTDNLLADWIQLPDAIPDQIAQSRQIKHIFTGNLNESIDCCPPFPGKERHLLRSQLARITHAAQICPKGLYELDEETQEYKMAEGGVPQDLELLKPLESWGHKFPIILTAGSPGRCSHFMPANLKTQEEKDELTAKLAEIEAPAERFRALNEDTPMTGLETAWTVKVAGDTQKYGGGEGGAVYAVAVVRSLRWPGAVTVAKGGKFCSVYVGDGVKAGGTSYFPTEPPEVQSDPLDQIENPEPTPLEAPEEPAEPDTDAEVNPEGEDGDAE